MILESDFSIGGGGERSGGGGGGDEPTDSESKLSDSKREEEDEEEEEMVYPNLEWMTHRPLALSTVLHKMPKWAKRMNIKFNLDSMVKEKDHSDNFYIKL